jgi:hypothetical protein
MQITTAHTLLASFWGIHKMTFTTKNKVTLCPSAPADNLDSVVFAISAGTVETPEVFYLPETKPVTKELLSLAEPVTPTEIFRFASPCAEKGCVHFSSNQCQLVSRVVTDVPSVTDALPPCRIRQDCQWWQQEGQSACFRCAQIVTSNYSPSAAVYEAAIPAA